MKRIGPIALLLCAGCQSITGPFQIGPETYTVAARMRGNFPAWSEVKGLAIEEGSAFCRAKGKQMQVEKWDTHGARGWTPLEAELTFKCM